MRLIDADALKDAIKTYIQNSAFWTPVYKLLAKVIDDAPTIEAEPVRHGEWAHLGGDEWCCTVCGEVIHTEGSWEKPTKKYCNECGAKMDGGAENVK